MDLFCRLYTRALDFKWFWKRKVIEPTANPDPGVIHMVEYVPASLKEPTPRTAGGKPKILKSTQELTKVEDVRNWVPFGGFLWHS